MKTRAASLALVLLAACGREPKRAVLGEWSAGGERMEFLADGRLLLKHGDGSVALAGYGFPEKRLLRVRELAATPADYRVAVTRDSLVLCRAAAPAECYRFARVGRLRGRMNSRQQRPEVRLRGLAAEAPRRAIR